MTSKIILSAVMATAIMGAEAQVNSPSAQGYLSRGLMMYDDNNFTGCSDQLSHIDRNLLPSDQKETVDYYIAMSALHTGDMDAEQLLEKFLGDYPYSTRREDVRMSIADILFTRNYAKALSAYKAVNPSALNDARHEDLIYRMSYCRLKLAEYDKALGGFKAIKSTKRYGNAARFYEGYIAYARRDYDTAESLFKTVNTSVAPGNMTDYYLSQIYFLRGDYSKALSTARSLLRRSGIEQSFTTETNRVAGESLYQLGNEYEAIPYLKKYVGSSENPLPSSLYILGINEYQSGNFDNAVRYLQPVTEEDNAMGQSAYLFIGQARLKQGEKDAAILAFDKALRMNHDPQVQEAAYYNYAVARFQGGNIPFGSSAATFEEFLWRYPSSRYTEDVQEYIVTGYMTDNNYESALASINRMKNPGSKILEAKQRVLYTLGARSLASGKTAEAIGYLTEAKSISSRNTEISREIRLMLGEAYYHNGQLDKAASELTSYISSAPSDAGNLPIAMYDMGYVRFGQKDYADARSYFNRLISGRGGVSDAVAADAWNRIGDSFYYSSDFSQAASAYDKAYETDPTAGDYALFQKAVMKGYTRDHSEKIRLLDTLQKQFPTSALIPDALLETTESYIQLGDNPAAIAVYRKLVTAYPSTAQGRQGYLQLALTLLNNGDEKQAIESYKEVISLYPTSDEARQAADELKRISAENGTLDEYIRFINGIPDAPRIDVSEADRLTFDAAEKAYMLTGDISRLRDYLKSYPDGAYIPGALSYLASARYESGDHTQAYEYASILTDRYPDNRLSEDAFAIKAEIDTRQGKGQSALQSWKQLELHASSAYNLNRARLGIMRVARDLGEDDQVIYAADALISSSTSGAEDKNEAICLKALALNRKGQISEARATWGSIADKTDDIYGAKSAFYLAESLFSTNDTDAAKATAEKLVNSGTPHTYWLARGFILLSDIYAAQGKEFESQEYLKALKENYPGNETDIFLMIDQRLNK